MLDLNKSPEDIERQRQIAQGRAMGEETEPVVSRATPRRTHVNTTQTRPEASKSSFQAKGHDAVLKSVQEREIPVKFTVNGIEKTGLIITRDRYTISVIFDGEDSATIVYKHAISMFKPLKGGK